MGPAGCGSDLGWRRGAAGCGGCSVTLLRQADSWEAAVGGLAGAGAGGRCGDAGMWGAWVKTCLGLGPRPETRRLCAPLTFMEASLLCALPLPCGFGHRRSSGGNPRSRDRTMAVFVRRLPPRRHRLRSWASARGPCG